MQTKGALSRSYGPRWHDYWSHPTSCGGGGGGNNLAGTFISATGQSCSYYVLFVQQEANNVYSAIISDTAGTASSALTINVDKLEYTGEKDDMISYISGVVAPDALSPKENAAFYSIISGVNSKNEAITQLYFINPVQFEFDSKSKKMRWKGEGAFKAIADSATQEADITIDAGDAVNYVTKR